LINDLPIELPSFEMCVLNKAWLNLSIHRYKQTSKRMIKSIIFVGTKDDLYLRNKRKEKSIKKEINTNDNNSRYL